MTSPGEKGGSYDTRRLLSGSAPETQLLAFCVCVVFLACACGSWSIGTSDSVPEGVLVACHTMNGGE